MSWKQLDGKGGQAWLVLVGKSWVGWGLSLGAALDLDLLPHLSGCFFQGPLARTGNGQRCCGGMS